MTLSRQSSEKRQREKLVYHVFTARVRCCNSLIPRRTQRSTLSLPAANTLVNDYTTTNTSTIDLFGLYYRTHACRLIHVLKYSTGSLPKLPLILVRVRPIRKFALIIRSCICDPAAFRGYLGPSNKFGLRFFSSYTLSPFCHTISPFLPC